MNNDVKNCLIEAIGFIEQFEINDARRRIDEAIDMLAAAPTPPAPEVEPVSYQMWHPNFPKWVNCNKSVADQMSAYNEGHIIRALYTHPANDGLRKAAEDVFAILNHLHHDRPETRRLRAELDKR